MPKTREEHLRRATGSFASVRPASESGETNNPRVLKARAAERAAAQAEALAAVQAAERAREQKRSQAASSAKLLDPVVAFAQGSVAAVGGKVAPVKADQVAPVGSSPLSSAARPAPAAQVAQDAPEKIQAQSRPADSPAAASDDSRCASDAAARALAAFSAANGASGPQPRPVRTPDDAEPAADAIAPQGSGRPSVAKAKTARPRARVKKKAAPAPAQPSCDPAADAFVPAAPPTPDTSEPDARAKRDTVASRRMGKGPIIVIALVVVMIAAAVGGFCANRWLCYDDAADFQGTWYIAGTDTPIQITEDLIVLNDEVSYRYVIDPGAKTIVFTFSYLKGEGHYRFSLDRTQLAIMDGSFTWFDTLSEDIGWMPGALLAAAQGGGASPAGPEGVTLLSRTSLSEQEAAAHAAAQQDGSAGAIAAEAAADAPGSDASPAPAEPAPADAPSADSSSSSDAGAGASSQAAAA